ncbi:ribonuclease H-like domain-containing protein [Tanacetum coccineum]
MALAWKTLSYEEFDVTGEIIVISSDSSFDLESTDDEDIEEFWFSKSGGKAFGSSSLKAKASGSSHQTVIVKSHVPIRNCILGLANGRTLDFILNKTFGVKIPTTGTSATQKKEKINIGDIDEIDIDDLYNNLRVYEDELKRSSGSNSASQNLAFLSSENTGSTNEVSTASGDFGVSTAGGINQVPSTPCAHDIAYSFLAQPTTSPQLENEDFQQMDGDDLEELDLRWQVAMLTVRVKKFIQRTGRNMDFKEKRHVSLDKSKIECYNCHRKGHFARECRSGRSQGRRSYGDNGRNNVPTNESSSQALVAQDGLGGYDWSNDFEVEPVNYALMAISSSSSSSSSNSEVQNVLNVLNHLNVFKRTMILK